jgi:hypothetical protein
MMSESRRLTVSTAFSLKGFLLFFGVACQCSS